MSARRFKAIAIAALCVLAATTPACAVDPAFCGLLSQVARQAAEARDEGIPRLREMEIVRHNDGLDDDLKVLLWGLIDLVYDDPNLTPDKASQVTGWSCAQHSTPGNSGDTAAVSR